jgi:hypothetical protein
MQGPEGFRNLRRRHHAAQRYSWIKPPTTSHDPAADAWRMLPDRPDRSPLRTFGGVDEDAHHRVGRHGALRVGRTPTRRPSGVGGATVAAA